MNSGFPNAGTSRVSSELAFAETTATRRSIGVAVITHAARDLLLRSLPPILSSVARPRVLVVNSSSGDGTVEEAERLGAETLVIPRSEFNHGATRNAAREKLGTDVVVLMTPDAFIVGDALSTLVKPVVERRAAVAYGRQLARPDAHVFERLLREHNYPEQSHTRSSADAAQWDGYLTFCSNAFAAWDNAALDEIGGFVETLSHEDAIAAAMLLAKGHRVAYVADAQVVHSHRYSVAGDFRRYFDAGYSRAAFAGVVGTRDSLNRLGHGYARGVVRRVMREQPSMLPATLLHLGAKWGGYKIGSRSAHAPVWLKRRFSGQDYYWSSIHAA
jgi:rhamnosyltransferase